MLLVLSIVIFKVVKLVYRLLDVFMFSLYDEIVLWFSEECIKILFVFCLILNLVWGLLDMMKKYMLGFKFWLLVKSVLIFCLIKVFLCMKNLKIFWENFGGELFIFNMVMWIVVWFDICVILFLLVVWMFRMRKFESLWLSGVVVVI